MYRDSILDGPDNITTTFWSVTDCLHACQQTTLIACTALKFNSANRECRLSEISTRMGGGQLIDQSGWDYYQMTTGKIEIGIFCYSTEF